MNLIDCYVTRVLGEPFRVPKPKDVTIWKKQWAVKVEYTAYGQPSTGEVWTDTEAEARSIGPGYHFLA